LIVLHAYINAFSFFFLVFYGNKSCCVGKKTFLENKIKRSWKKVFIEIYCDGPEACFLKFTPKGEILPSRVKLAPRGGVGP
jgi:hypothetical protein